MFDDLLDSHYLRKSEIADSPFVYVDIDDGSVKLVTKVLNAHGVDHEVHALSVASEGDLQFLSTED